MRPEVEVWVKERLFALGGSTALVLLESGAVKTINGELRFLPTVREGRIDSSPLFWR